MSERFKPNKNAIYDKYNLVQEKHLNNEWLLEPVAACGNN